MPELTKWFDKRKFLILSFAILYSIGNLLSSHQFDSFELLGGILGNLLGGAILIGLWDGAHGLIRGGLDKGNKKMDEMSKQA